MNDKRILKWSDGDMFWYLDGRLHRYYGPATRWSVKWYIHGELIK